MNKKDFYTQNLKQQIKERQNPVDTTQVQLDSVILFMEQFNYIPNNRPHATYVKGLCGFKRNNTCPKEVNLPMFISLQDACRLHNGIMMRVVGGKWCDLVGMVGSFPMNVYLSACEARLVEKVYLQRKGISVKCQQHWVKFVD